MSFLDYPRFPSDTNYKLVREINYLNHIVKNQAGVEQINAITTQPQHRYDVVYVGKDKTPMQKLQRFFHVVCGRLHCFRFKDEFDCTSTNNPNHSPTATDQYLSGIVDGLHNRFQLAKWYKADNLTTVRYITKPILQSVQVSIDGITVNSDFYTVSDSGVVEFTHNDKGDIKAVSNTYPCEFTARNKLSAGQSIILHNMRGMPSLNDARCAVLAATPATITLNLDTRNSGEYTGGGAFNSLPSLGESVRAGFEFDVPVRFEQDRLSMRIDADNVYSVDSLSLVEVLTP